MSLRCFSFFFFFSSRRRHTRSKRDWSSDVCSSDLRSLVALAFLPLRGQAQTPGAVYGTVLDTAGAPIADVHISTAGAAAASDAAGHYRVTGIRPGRAVLRFARLGYRVAQDTVAVPAGDSVRLDVTLRSSRFALEPVIVTAAKRSQLLDQSATSVALVSDSDLARRAVSTVDEAVD